MATAVLPKPVQHWETHPAQAGDVYSLVYQLPSPCDDGFWRSVGSRSISQLTGARGVTAANWTKYVQASTFYGSALTSPSWRRISATVIECWIVVTEPGPLGQRLLPTLRDVCANGGDGRLVSVYFWETLGGFTTSIARATDAMQAGRDDAVDAVVDPLKAAAENVADLGTFVLDKLIVTALVLFSIWVVITDGGRRGSAPRF